MADQNNHDSSDILRQVSSLASYAAIQVVIWFWTYAYEIENDRRTTTKDIRLEREKNYLRGVDPNDELLAQVDVELMNDNTVHDEVSNSREMVDMAKKAKEFTLSYLNVQENFVCNWTNTMDDTLVDAYCHEDALGHRVGGTFTSHAMDNIVKDLRLKFPNKVKPQAAELKNKSFRNYEKLVMLYGKDRATEKHAETGSDMLKRNAHKNPKKSSADSFTIDEIDEMGYINTDSLKDMEVHEQGMTDMLRGGMDNLAGAINWISPLPPISENEIWNMLEKLNLEAGVNTKAYIFLCQNASACRILIGCPKEQSKSLLREMMPEDNEDPQFWTYKPLSDLMVRAAADDVRFLPYVFHKMIIEKKSSLDGHIAIERLLGDPRYCGSTLGQQYPTTEKPVMIEEQEKMTRKLRRLELAMKNLQGLGGYKSVSYKDLCMFPGVNLPPSFKMPKFEKYDKHGDPVAHLRRYCNQLRGTRGKEELLMVYFEESLSGLASECFVDQDIDK
ncbi:putative NAC domain-containing protein 66-like [Capsicum annuum]|nr:putative NAC domain-containing protein 66-like [Capsicum annuum]